MHDDRPQTFDKCRCKRLHLTTLSHWWIFIVGRKPSVYVLHIPAAVVCGDNNYIFCNNKSRLANSKYLHRHNQVAKIIHQQLALQHKLADLEAVLQVCARISVLHGTGYLTCTSQLPRLPDPIPPGKIGRCQFLYGILKETLQFTRTDCR